MTKGIEVDHLGVRFVFDRQRRPVTPALAKLRRRSAETWGLRDVSLTVGPGEGVALMGSSGSGKTTLLRTLAGIYEADAGRVHVEGRIGSLLSTGAGLMPPLTGRENCTLLGVLAGLPLSVARTIHARVATESGLDDAFERPVSSYSQGMRARLGLTVAEVTNPSILLLDEVHEALDHEFRLRVERRVESLLADGGIVVAAGHDHPLLERFCSRATLLRDGAVEADGPFESVRDAYFSESDSRG